MTTAELITRFNDTVAYDLDTVGGPLSDSAVVTYLNQAQLELSKRACLYSAQVTFTPVADQLSYDLRGSAFAKKMHRIENVIFGKAALTPYSLEKLERDYEFWRTDSSQVPQYWAGATGTSIVLYPKPSTAAVDLGNHYVSGYILAADLSSAAPSGVSELPTELHPYIATLAAAMASEPNATEPSQINRINTLRARAYEEADRVQEQNENTVKDFVWDLPKSQYIWK